MEVVGRYRASLSLSSVKQRLLLLRSYSSSLNPQSSVDFVSQSGRGRRVFVFLFLRNLGERVNCRKTRWKSKAPRSLALGGAALFLSRQSDDALPAETPSRRRLAPLFPSQTYLIENRHPSLFSLHPEFVVVLPLLLLSGFSSSRGSCNLPLPRSRRVFIARKLALQ